MLHAYTEVYNDQTQQWECQQRSSYYVVNDGTFTMHTMESIVSERQFESKKALKSILSMSDSSAFPFAFPCRTLPVNVTDEVFHAIADSFNSLTGWRTRQELEAKLGELILIGTQESYDCISPLKRIIDAMPAHDGNPDLQRLIYTC